MKEFKSVEELIKLCKDMKLSNYRYFKFVGTDYPDVNDLQSALNKEIPKEEGAYFECSYLKPPELAVRITRHPGSRIRSFI